MPVKKRLPKGRLHKITSEAVDAFREGDDHALRNALKLAPWEASPLDLPTIIEADGSAWWASIPKAEALRSELMQAQP